MEGWQEAGARIAQTTRAEKMERWEEVIQELLLEKSGLLRYGCGVVLFHWYFRTENGYAGTWRKRMGFRE